MKSFNTSKTRKNINYPIVILAALSVVMFIFRKSPIVEFVQGEMQMVFMSQKSFFYSLGRSSESEQIAKIKEENLELYKKIADVDKLKQDNVALRSQFETNGIVSTALTSAKILGFTGDSSLPETLIINAGSNEKVKKGMAVVIQNYLIGKVTDVSINHSQVTTVLSPNFKTLAKVSASGANGILFGNKDFMILDRVVITEKLEKGGLVVTRGEVNSDGIGIYPDLIIGKMTAISKNEAAPFQGAQVSPIIDFSKLRNVFVIVSM